MRWIFLIFGVLIFLFSFLFETLWPLVGGCVLLLVRLVVWRNLFLQCAYALALFIPLSISFPILSGTVVQLPSEWLLAVIGLALILKSLVFKTLIPTILQHPLPILWLMAQLLAVWFSSHPLVSIKFWLVQCVYVTVFFYGAMALLTSHQQAEKHVIGLLVTHLVGIGVVLLSATMFYFSFGWNPVTRPGIFKPFYNDHTLIGASLAMLAGAFFVLSKHTKVFLFLAAFAVAGVLLGASRAAILGLATIPFAILFFKWKFVRWGVLFVGAMSVGLAFYFPINWEQFDTGAKRDDFTKQNLATHTVSVVQFRSDYSNLERINRWVSALGMAKERPFFGFGPGTYHLEYIPYQQPDFETPLRVRNPDSPPLGSGGSAHSELLLQLSESGLFTVILFVIMLMQWVRVAIGKPNHTLVFAAFIGLSTYVIHMQVNNFLDIDKFAALFWFFGAIIQSQVQQESLVETQHKQGLL